MTTFTELMAVVLVQSSAAAYSHFGVTLEPAPVERAPTVERTVARSAPQKPSKPAESPQLRTGSMKS